MEKGRSGGTTHGKRLSDTMVRASATDSIAQKDLKPEEKSGGAVVKIKMIKRGVRGKAEGVGIVVDKESGLARNAATTLSNENAQREKDIMKSRILDYAAASANSDSNIFLNETKVKANTNKKLGDFDLDREFGISTGGRGRGRGGEGVGAGRGAGRGRGGGSGVSGRTLKLF